MSLKELESILGGPECLLGPTVEDEKERRFFAVPAGDCFSGVLFFSIPRGLGTW